MITNLLLNNPWIYSVLAGSYALLEYWLGKTPTTKAGSVIELIVLLLRKLAGREKTVIVQQSAPVAKELNEWFVFIEALARDYKAGVKPADMVGKELGALMTALQDSDQIPAEWRADPVAFGQTLGAAIGRLVALIVSGGITPAVAPKV